MDLNEVSIFIKVVQLGSFSKAAQQLAMPNSTVSAKVSSLEKRLGVTLIQRTTRRLNVTPAGQEYFKKCLQGLEEILAGEQLIAASQGEPQGLLRITAPIELGGTVLPSLVREYTKKYPKVNVEVLLSDRRIELLSENVDLAIRAGELKDSTLIAKKLGDGCFALYASAKYIKAHGTPKHPRDLNQFECIPFTALGFESWKLVGPKGTLNIPLKSRLMVNDLNMVKQLAVEGAGIALLPKFFCHNEATAGKLVAVLPDWHSTYSPVHFVYPAQKFVSSKISAFIELATEPIKMSLLGRS